MRISFERSLVRFTQPSRNDMRPNYPGLSTKNSQLTGGYHRRFHHTCLRRRSQDFVNSRANRCYLWPCRQSARPFSLRPCFVRRKEQPLSSNSAVQNAKGESTARRRLARRKRDKRRRRRSSEKEKEIKKAYGARVQRGSSCTGGTERVKRRASGAEGEFV